MTELTKHDIAKMIDHAILRPSTTQAVLLEELELAHQLNVYSVCVRPSQVASAFTYLTDKNSSVLVGTVIGFPHGSQHHLIKSEEIKLAIEEGATEVDIVIDIGLLKDALTDPIAAELLWSELSEQDDIAKLHGAKITKLILETALLTPEEIVLASDLGVEAGFDFIKTSTGFATQGATIINLAIMKEAVAGRAQLKASGGVGNLATLYEMYALGVTRFGTSKTKNILDEHDEQFTQDLNPNAY